MSAANEGAEEGFIQCELCGRRMKSRGIGMHRKSCLARLQTTVADEAYLQSLREGGNDEHTRQIEGGAYLSESNTRSRLEEQFEVSELPACHIQENVQHHGNEMPLQDAPAAESDHGTQSNDTDEVIHVDCGNVEEEVEDDAVDSNAPSTNPLPQPELGGHQDPNAWRPKWNPPVDPQTEFEKLVAYDPRYSSELKAGDIMTVYHPGSNLPTTISHQKDYAPRAEVLPLPQTSSNDPERLPWHPFSELLDFEFAELALEAHLSQDQINRLLSVIWRVAGTNNPKFTLKTYKDLNKSWENASDLHAKFQKYNIGVRYKTIDFNYDLHSKPIWDWVLEQLSDPKLIPKMHWDARRLYRFDGYHWTSFVNEPFTACRAWNVQTTLPANAKPLGLIVYADKTKLSSFGTVKGYPVMMCISNLSQETRNGVGVGSTRIVGWLPIVHEDAEHKKKTTFTNFKRVVWHASFRVILETVASYSQIGFRTICADRVERILYPFVHILVADYEEQCVMTLIRGVKSAKPCPVCHVGASQQTNLEYVFPRRTAAEAQAIVWNRHLNKTQKEAQLKPLSLRDIENAFWLSANSDPHDANAADRLHINHGGNGSDHMLPQVQTCIEGLGRDAIGKVDKQMSLLPRWRNINHFRAIVGVHFTDGRKYEDICKFIIYASHNVLTREASPAGYCILRCMRAYVEHDMYLGLEQHTEETLAAGRACLLKFGRRIQEYKALAPEKDWNYPKYHTGSHGYFDIEDKGVTANFSTKGFEKHHGPAKGFYNLEGNKKDPEKQVLRGEQRSFIALNLRAEIDRWNAERKALSSEEGAEPKVEAFQFGDVYLGSRDAPRSLAEIGAANAHDLAFQDLPSRLSIFVNRELCAPQGLQRIRYRDTDHVIQCHYLKVNYQSTVTWAKLTDYLRCSPLFHGSVRNDGVMYSTSGGQVAFGQLVAIFACAIGQDQIEPVAMILPMDLPMGPRLLKDEELGLYRLKARQRHLCEFITPRKIIRGAFLAPAFDETDSFLAVDVVDSDMFIRFRNMFGY